MPVGYTASFVKHAFEGFIIITCSSTHTAFSTCSVRIQIRFDLYIYLPIKDHFQLLLQKLVYTNYYVVYVRQTEKHITSVRRLTIDLYNLRNWRYRRHILSNQHVMRYVVVTFSVTQKCLVEKWKRVVHFLLSKMTAFMVHTIFNYRPINWVSDFCIKKINLFEKFYILWNKLSRQLPIIYLSFCY